MGQPTDRKRFRPVNRLRKRAEFDRVFREGRVIHGRRLIVRLLATGGEQSRLGLAVNRRLGKAPRRNRLRRVIREAFRLNCHRFPRAVDLVVVPRQGAPVGDARLGPVAEELVEAVRRGLAADGEETERPGGEERT